MNSTDPTYLSDQPKWWHFNITAVDDDNPLFQTYKSSTKDMQT